MELHWESVRKEDDINESVTVLAPGIWLILIDQFVMVHNEYRCELNVHNLAISQQKYKSVCSNKDEHEQKLINCKKYAAIIASSFLGQQHPYRDYPKNL